MDRASENPQETADRLRRFAEQERSSVELIERSPEDQAFYKKVGNLTTVGGFVSAVAATGWMYVEAAKMALSTTETGYGGLIVAGSIAVAINVGNAFHNAAKHSNGPDSDAAHNVSRISAKNVFGYVVGALMGGIACATAITEQDNKRTEQVLWANAPHMDPSIIVRHVSAAEEHCAGQRKGKLVQHDLNGVNHVFRCP
jgi:Co/Zn/Cd efflux system component